MIELLVEDDGKKVGNWILIYGRVRKEKRKLFFSCLLLLWSFSVGREKEKD